MLPDNVGNFKESNLEVIVHLTNYNSIHVGFCNFFVAIPSTPWKIMDRPVAVV